MSLRKLHLLILLVTIVGFLRPWLSAPTLHTSTTVSRAPDLVFVPDTGFSTRQPVIESDEESLYFPVQFRNPKDLGSGKLLVASRGLADPNFAGTVVLLVHYDDDGVVGLILNRRTDFPLSRALDLQAAKDRSDRLYVGGPVGTSSVFALLQSAAKPDGAEHVVGPVYLISSKTLFEQTLSKQPDPGAFHVYLGYAGWNPEQLRKEVALGAWFIFPGDVTAVFDSRPESLWPRMIHKTELELAQAIVD